MSGINSRCEIVLRFFVSLLYLEILLLNIRKILRYYWKRCLRGRRNQTLKVLFNFLCWRNQITYISIHLSEQNMWIAIWYGFASSKLALDVKNRSILKSNDKSRSIDQERPANTNSSFVSFLRSDKNCGPRKYDKSNKTLPSTHSLPSYLVNNASKNFLSNEHLTRQHCNKTYNTETGLNWQSWM